MKIIGSKYGRWKVLSKTNNDRTGHTRYLCQCECGEQAKVLRQNLVNETSKSCGCLANELSSERAPHGEAVKLTKLYTAWRNMHNRCRYKGDPSYQWYGARGIKVCKRWKSFINFRDDMAPHPGGNFTLDRIDNDGNYTKSNCIWKHKSEHIRDHNIGRL